MSRSKLNYNGDLTLISVRLNADTIQKLVYLAGCQQMSLSQYIRAVLDSYIAKIDCLEGVRKM